MKIKIQVLFTLIIAAFISQASLKAQFDDLYYDPDRDRQVSNNSEFVEEDGYYDVDEYNYEDDYYYDDYDYATRINRFRRAGRALDYFSMAYMMNSWNAWGYDPFYDPFIMGSPGLAININIGNNWGWNRWNNFGWNRWRPWGSTWAVGWNNWGWNSWGFNRWNRWNNWGWNSWCPTWGFGNNFYANNVFVGNGWAGNGWAGNRAWNNGWNRYDRVTNPNGVYYGSRRSGSATTSVNGRLRSPRTTNDYITSRVTPTDTKSSRVSSSKSVKSYRRGDIATNSVRTNRIMDRNRRDRDTYRGTTNSRTPSRSINRGSSRTIDRGSSRTINRGSSRTINRGSSRTINRGNSKSSINRNRSTSRGRSVSPRSNSSRNNRSLNSSRSNNRSSSSMNRSRSSTRSSSMNRSSSRSSSSRSSTRSSSSRKRNN